MNKSYKVKFIKEAQTDYFKLDGSLKKPVIASILKISENPLSSTQGGYGKPLGSHNDTNLTNFFKIKLKKYGIRIVYTLVKDEDVINIVVISVRDDSKCYTLAELRKNNYGQAIFTNIFDSLKQ